MNVDAYNKLIQTVYPFNMPFNLWVEETRTYLEHLGTSRYEIIDTFKKIETGSDTSKTLPTKQEIACEYMKITKKESDILINSSETSVWEYYGYDHKDLILFSWDDVMNNDYGEMIKSLSVISNSSNLFSLCPYSKFYTPTSLLSSFNFL